MKVISLMFILTLSIACGGGNEKSQTFDNPTSRFTEVYEKNQLIGYHFENDDGSVLFVPLDEMPPAAPVGLEQ